jgi:hypothetical protein
MRGGNGFSLNPFTFKGKFKTKLINTADRKTLKRK